MKHTSSSTSGSSWYKTLCCMLAASNLILVLAMCSIAFSSGGFTAYVIPSDIEQIVQMPDASEDADDPAITPQEKERALRFYNCMNQGWRNNGVAVNATDIDATLTKCATAHL